MLLFIVIWFESCFIQSNKIVIYRLPNQFPLQIPKQLFILWFFWSTISKLRLFCPWKSCLDCSLVETLHILNIPTMLSPNYNVLLLLGSVHSVHGHHIAISDQSCYWTMSISAWNLTANNWAWYANYSANYLIE